MYLPEGVGRREEVDTFDLRGSLQRVFDACRTFKVTVFVTMFLTLALTYAYLSLWPPIYTAEVTVFADSPKDTLRESFYENWNVFRREDLATEAELMSAGPVITRVVRELGLTYDDVYHPFMSQATYLWTKSWVGRHYRSVKHFFFPQKKGPYDPTPAQIELSRMVKDFKEGVELKPVPDSNVGRLTVRGPSPRVAELANKLVDTYLDERSQRFVDEAQRAHDALAAEVAKASAELLATDVERRDYLEKNGLAFDFDADKYELALTTEMDLKVREAEADLEGAKRKHAELLAQLGQEPVDQVSEQITEVNQLRERMKLSRLDLEVQLAAISQRYRPDSPEVMELTNRIKRLDEQIAAEPEMKEKSTATALNLAREEVRRRELELGSELPKLEASIQAKKQALGRLQAKHALIPGKFAKGVELMRDLRLRELRFNALSERLAMARVSLATVRSAPASMRVAEYAMPPADPTWPKPRLFYLVALLVGGLAGVSAALLMDVLQGRVTRTRLLQTRTGVAVYGTLELASETPARALLPRTITLERTRGMAGNGHKEDS
jgi:uncharacterized protein involved in exopolysaccharide biosynthesis